MFIIKLLESSCKLYIGHAGSVSNVKFTHDGEYLISIGATDHTIFQWKFIRDEVNVIPNLENFKNEELTLTIRTEIPKSNQSLKLLKGSDPVDSDNKVEAGKKRKLVSDIVHSQPKGYKLSRVAVFFFFIIG